MSEDFLPLLAVEPDKIADRVLVCGDPARAKKIAERLDRAEEISYNREYRLFNGRKDGEKISVVSHGVGAAGAAVCFEELISGGAREIIRVGTAGSLAPDRLEDGDIVIASAAVRKDGVTHQLVETEFPATADVELTRRLQKSADNMGLKTCTGIVLTADVFYPELEEVPNDYYSQTGALAVEMEASALFVIASLNEVRAGAVMAIDGIAVDWAADEYDPHREEVDKAVAKEIELALRALE